MSNFTDFSLLEAANKYYPDRFLANYYRPIKWEGENNAFFIESSGDGLARFVVTEIMEAAENDVERAIELMETAKNNLDSVIKGLNEDLKKENEILERGYF